MMCSSVGMTSGLIALGGTGTRFRIWSKMTAVVWPLKVWTPVAISYITTPSENRSLRWSTASPRACSGDM